jgi:cytochrome c oxidase subunit 2
MSSRLIGLAVTGALAIVFGAAGLYVWANDDESPTSGATSTPVSVTDAVAAGRNLFLNKGCTGCHQIVGVSGGIEVGPNLTLLAQRAGERVAGMSAEQYVRASILTPDAYIVSGYANPSPMPQLLVSDDELDALVAFLLVEQ